jgi:hypothetical protein
MRSVSAFQEISVQLRDLIGKTQIGIKVIDCVESRKAMEGKKKNLPSATHAAARRTIDLPCPRACVAIWPRSTHLEISIGSERKRKKFGLTQFFIVEKSGSVK